ncbi:MAG: hypothetical protein K0V04_23785 [Deltaproteobacteria bacterium]|nr:hypothetical protein [Deltaproteobacteria bacterium]
MLSRWKSRVAGLCTAGVLTLSMLCAPQPAQASASVVWWGSTLVIDGMDYLLLIGLPSGVSPSAAGGGATVLLEWIPLGPAAGAGAGATTGGGIGVGAGSVVVVGGAIVIAAVGLTLGIDTLINDEPLWEELDSDTLGDDDFWEILTGGNPDYEPVDGGATVSCSLDALERWQACRGVFGNYAVDESLFGDTLCADVWSDSDLDADDPSLDICSDMVAECVILTTDNCNGHEEPDPGADGEEADDGGYDDPQSEDDAMYEG